MSKRQKEYDSVLAKIRNRKRGEKLIFTKEEMSLLNEFGITPSVKSVANAFYTIYDNSSVLQHLLAHTKEVPTPNPARFAYGTYVDGDGTAYATDMCSMIRVEHSGINRGFYLNPMDKNKIATKGSEKEFMESVESMRRQFTEVAEADKDSDNTLVLNRAKLKALYALSKVSYLCENERRPATIRLFEDDLAEVTCKMLVKVISTLLHIAKCDSPVFTVRHTFTKDNKEKGHVYEIKLRGYENIVGYVCSLYVSSWGLAPCCDIWKYSVKDDTAAVNTYFDQPEICVVDEKLCYLHIPEEIPLVMDSLKTGIGAYLTKDQLRSLYSDIGLLLKEKETTSTKMENPDVPIEVQEPKSTRKRRRI